MQSEFTINILTTDGPQYDYLIRQLEEHFTVNLVIRESGKSQRRRCIKQKKYKRYLCNRYQYCIRNLLGYGRYRKRYFKTNGSIESDIIDVENINSNYTIDLLQRNPCNLYVVMGTSILKPSVIEICNTDIINVHGGFLPYYRGNNCIYFAYLNSEFDKIANTIHYIDSGIDTGNIIKIIKPNITPKDNPETLYCKAKKMAIDELINVINLYKKDGCLPVTIQDKNIGHQYKTEERNPFTDLKCFFKTILLR